MPVRPDAVPATHACLTQLAGDHEAAHEYPRSAPLAGVVREYGALQVALRDALGVLVRDEPSDVGGRSARAGHVEVGQSWQHRHPSHYYSILGFEQWG